LDDLRTRCPEVRTPGLVATTATATPLTAREREIAELAARQLSAAEIAERLFLSRRTVENHLQRIYTKLGISSRSELAEVLEQTSG
jgi:DNA-binding CsgD family transcriptional regulator